VILQELYSFLLEWIVSTRHYAAIQLKARETGTLKMAEEKSEVDCLALHGMIMQKLWRIMYARWRRKKWLSIDTRKTTKAGWRY
jgi:hypothetical protein